MVLGSTWSGRYGTCSTLPLRSQAYQHQCHITFARTSAGAKVYNGYKIKGERGFRFKVMLDFYFTSFQPCKLITLESMAYRGEGVLGCSNPPPPKFRRPSKIVPNSTRLWKLLKTAELRTPTHKDVRKKGSTILKLPPVRNCFILAMTNKLVVIYTRGPI